MSVGNVLSEPLAAILAGQAMTDRVASIPPQRRKPCDPDQECTPGTPGSDCNPRT
jgi:hypothetical protein